MTDREIFDLGETLERAVLAARRGDLIGLEIEIAELGRMQTDSDGTITRKLRAIAQAVHNHPSRREARAAAG